jgi:hypothetical protein
MAEKEARRIRAAAESRFSFLRKILSDFRNTDCEDENDMILFR